MVMWWVCSLGSSGGQISQCPWEGYKYSESAVYQELNIKNIFLSYAMFIGKNAQY